MFAESVMSSHHTHEITDNRYSIYHRVGDGDTHKSGELTVICKFASKKTGLRPVILSIFAPDSPAKVVEVERGQRASASTS